MPNIITTRLVEMSAAEARRYGVPLTERRRYFKVLSDSEYGSVTTNWFREFDVDLGDGSEPVRIAEKWSPAVTRGSRES